MATLRIEVEEVGRPSAHIDIPLWMARGADILLPDTARKNLADKIDIDRLLDSVDDPASRGMLLEIEDHTDGEKVRISII